MKKRVVLKVWTWTAIGKRETCVVGLLTTKATYMDEMGN